YPRYCWTTTRFMVSVFISAVSIIERLHHGQGNTPNTLVEKLDGGNSGPTICSAALAASATCRLIGFFTKSRRVNRLERQKRATQVSDYRGEHFGKNLV